jgi:hypothetical protein
MLTETANLRPTFTRIAYANVACSLYLPRSALTVFTAPRYERFTLAIEEDRWRLLPTDHSSPSGGELRQ